MKTFNGNTWQETDAKGLMRIGFSQAFIDTHLSECFHVIQADASKVKAGGPMMVLETNDGLHSLRSPLAGTITYFNDKARNYPDRLTEEDTILIIRPVGVKVEEKVSPKVSMDVNTLMNNFLAARQQQAINITANPYQVDYNLFEDELLNPPVREAF